MGLRRPERLAGRHAAGPPGRPARERTGPPAGGSVVTGRAAGRPGARSRGRERRADGPAVRTPAGPAVRTPAGRDDGARRAAGPRHAHGHAHGHGHGHGHGQRDGPAVTLLRGAEPTVHQDQPRRRRRRSLLRPLVSAGRVSALIGVLALVAASWPLITSPQMPQVEAIGILAHASGMLAGGGAVVLLLLVARTPALEHGLGADVLARWHARGGPLVIVLVLVHAGAATVAWGMAAGSTTAGGIAQMLSLPWLQAATVGTVLMLVVAGASVPVVRRRLSHERWHSLHLLVYLAVALGFGHQLAGPDLVGHRWLQVGWALAYAWTIALVVQHRVVAPIRQTSRHRLQVASVQAEGPGVATIVVGGQHLHELAARPGQFFRWRFLTPDHWATAHPFSLSAAPTDSTLRLTVKALGDGSRNLQDLAVGTWVVAEGPYGVATTSHREGRGVLLVAGGVGITPMRALFESVELSRGEDLTLVYRSRTDADVLFRAELDEIAARRGARVVHVRGPGRDLLGVDALLDLVPDLAWRDVYVCGPLGLMDAVRRATREAGLPRRQLHEERFSL